MIPEYLNRKANELIAYQKLVFWVLPISLLLLVLVSIGLKGANTSTLVIQLTLMYSLSISFFLLGFFSQFKSLWSSSIVSPIWYYVCRIVEWVNGVIIITMLVGLLVSYPFMLVWIVANAN
jgi:hypothetical protein